MSTTPGRGRLFFQAAGDPTCPSELSPKRQNPHIESSLTKRLASSQFLIILYPWIGSIKGHYRLVRPGRRGSYGTLVIYTRNQQVNVQFDLKTKSRDRSFDISYQPFGVPIRSRKSDIWKVPKKRFSENPPKINLRYRIFCIYCTQEWVLRQAVAAYFSRP